MIKPHEGNVSKSNAVLLIEAFSGKSDGTLGKYLSMSWDGDAPLSASRHPFMGDSANPVFVYWCGSPGVTASIGVWVREVCRELLKWREADTMSITYWKTINGDNSDYIFEFELNDMRWLVGGINNYSGEGRSGAKAILKFTNALFGLYSPKLKCSGLKVVSKEMFNSALNQHSDAIMEELRYQEA